MEQYLQNARKYRMARMNLMGMAALTIINVICVIAGANFYFPFSATLPSFLVLLLSRPDEISALAIVLSVVIIGAFFLCFFLSKKHLWGMIAAFVLFVLDTLVLLYFMLIAFDVTFIIDLLFHAWVLYYLIVGIMNGSKMSGLEGGVAVSENEIAAKIQQQQTAQFYGQQGADAQNYATPQQYPYAGGDRPGLTPDAQPDQASQQPQQGDQNAQSLPETPEKRPEDNK